MKVSLIFALLLCASVAQANTASDSFNRANGGLGANWSTPTGSIAPTITSNQVAGNTAGTTASSWQMAYWSGSSFTGNQTSTAAYTGTSGGSSTGFTGVGAHLSSNGSGYLCIWLAGTLYLQRMDTATTGTGLTSGSASTLNNGDVMGISIQGSTISCSVNGTTIVSASDSAYGSGSVGIVVSGTGAFATLDSWTGQDSNTLTSTTIASGSVSTGTPTVAAGACSTPITITATGVQSTDSISMNYQGNPSTAGNPSLYLAPYATTNAVNFVLCNSSANSITATGVTLNWRVVR